MRFKAGQLLFSEGEEAKQFYMIREGKVVLEIPAAGRRIVIQTVGEGDV